LLSAKAKKPLRKGVVAWRRAGFKVARELEEL
jgi:hypothetical protein